MKADALNPKSLFDGNVHYEIPVFQRPYVWDEENQWAPLWADIVRVAEKVVAAGQDADALKQLGGHFLGAIVVESRAPKVGDVTRHVIIDGQQRSTTLQVLIDAVQQVVTERGHELMGEDLESLILNKSALFKGKPERFKLVGYPDHGSSSDGPAARQGRSSGSAARLSGHTGRLGGEVRTGCGLGNLISWRIVVGEAVTAPSSSRRNSSPRARECRRLKRNVNSSR